MKKGYILFMMSFAFISLKAIDSRKEAKIYQAQGQQYAYVYNMADQTVAPNTAVAFDSTGMISSGISHTAGDSKIVINEAGIYVVTFLVQGVPADSFALFQNNIYVAGSSYEPTININSRVDKEFSQVIIQAQAGDILTLKNYSPVRDQGNAILKAAGKPSVNASVLITQLAQS